MLQLTTSPRIDYRSIFKEKTSLLEAPKNLRADLIRLKATPTMLQRGWFQLSVLFLLVVVTFSSVRDTRAQYGCESYSFSCCDMVNYQVFSVIAQVRIPSSNSSSLK